MSNISTQDELKEALKNDFNELLVKEFTTDWQIQRLKIGLDIEVMSFDNLTKLIEAYKDNACRELLDKLEAETTHNQRTCLGCGNTWWGLHCPHDGYQNPCGECGLMPTPISGNCKCESELGLSELQAQRNNLNQEEK